MSDVVISFEGVELKNVSPRKRRTAAGKKKKLLSGGYNIQFSDSEMFEETFSCYTTDYADILAIKAKKSVIGRLVITDPNDPLDIRNVAITEDIDENPVGLGWTYDVTFTQTV